MRQAINQSRVRLASIRAGGVLRALVAVLFAFQANYIPLHLATEAHVADWQASFTVASFHSDHCPVVEHCHHGDESGHHAPHRASEHLLVFTLKKPSAQFTPTVDFTLTDNPLRITKPALHLDEPVWRIDCMAGQSPPDPRQPRAPPPA